MGRKLLILFLTLSSFSALANGDDWVRQQEENKVKAEKNLEKRQQRMEVLDDDSYSGDVKGNKMDKEPNQTEKARHDAEKQKFLYEYDGYYRKGL